MLVTMFTPIITQIAGITEAISVGDGIAIILGTTPGMILGTMADGMIRGIIVVAGTTAGGIVLGITAVGTVLGITVDGMTRGIIVAGTRHIIMVATTVLMEVVTVTDSMTDITVEFRTTVQAEVQVVTEPVPLIVQAHLQWLVCQVEVLVHAQACHQAE